MLDRDLAVIYGVETWVLNQAGKAQHGTISTRVQISAYPK